MPRLTRRRPWRPRYRWLVQRWERGEWETLIGRWRSLHDAEEACAVWFAPVLVLFALEEDPAERELRVIRTVVFRA